MMEFSERELAARKKNRGAMKHPYLKRRCPVCAGEVRSSPTDPDLDPVKQPRRISVHFVDGAQCEGSHAIVEPPRRGRPRRES